MDTSSPLYNELNKAWKSTCKILFGEEIGELKEYEEWLKEDYFAMAMHTKSQRSGREVILTTSDYCPHARFVSLSEISQKEPASLSINEIKDIDSIIEALSERFEYCGNKVLGKSHMIENSDFIVDSSYVLDSCDIEQSSYIFASRSCRLNSSHIFGAGVGNSEFVIKGIAWLSKRCFNSLALHSSDAYYSYYINGCTETMFSFNLFNKKYCIGNLELQPDKYATIKRKLLSEITEILRKEKRIFSLYDLIKGVPEPKTITVTQRKEREEMKPINNAFATTFKVLLKRDPGDIQLYEDWLFKYKPRWERVISPFGNRTYKVTDAHGYVWLNMHQKVPEKRWINDEEAVELSKFHLNEREISDLESIRKNLSKIGFFVTRVIVERNENYIDTPTAADAFNTYKVGDATATKYAGICGHTGHSEYIFGSHRILNSKFCINAYYSQHLMRCFEVDCCVNCSDTYFAHNCEGLQEAMFCWNVKGKRYAIGNTQLPPDQYRKIKDMLVEQMADEIIRTKQLRYDIYNIGCAGKV